MRSRILICHMGMLLAFGAGALEAEPRDFTSADGRTLQAELTGFLDGQVRMKLANGNEVTVPILNFSEPDREYIDLWATDPARSTVEPSEIPVEDFLARRGFVPVKYNDEKFAMIVELTIADRPHQFIINTGLPYSYLDGPMADVLGLTVRQIPDFLSGPDGAVPIGEAILENFAMGGQTFPKRTFRVANLATTGLNNTGVKVDGVLGFDFLMENQVVLDYKTKTIYILPPPAAK